MKFTVDYPTGAAGFDPAFLDPAMMTRFVTSIESLGFDAVAFTEHPAPSKKWLDAGGHESFDVLTALAFCAASTTTLKLVTNLFVLPYRNPLLAAKQIATTDVLSGGRTIVGVGGGYLRSEFAALGVDFEERNDLVDEALEVLTGIWRSDSFTYTGRHFSAGGQISRPVPVQLPHPPLWVGGNSRKARERVASHCQGWAPMMTAPHVSATTRTAAIESVEQLAAVIGDLRDRLGEAGRGDEAVDVQLSGGRSSSATGNPDETLALLEELGKVGVTYVCINPPGANAESCLEALEAYSTSVIAPARGL